MNPLAVLCFVLLVVILACGFAMGLIVGNGRYYLMRRQVILLTRKLETGMKRLEPEALFSTPGNPLLYPTGAGNDDDEDFLEMIRRRR